MKKNPLLLQYSLLLIFSTGLIGVQKGFSQCTADFTFTADSILGRIQLVSLVNPVNSDSPITYQWKDASGNVLSNLANPHWKPDPGMFNLCLNITNAGCVDSICKEIMVPSRYCKASFTYQTNQNTGEVVFTNSTIGDSAKFYWSFGDGSYASSANPVHTFDQNGWYYVCLNMENKDSSCKDVACEFIRINKPSPAPCEALWTYTYDSIDSKKVRFQNLSVGDSLKASGWLFGDGSDNPFQENPVHQFDSVGMYKVCLLISGPDCADSTCKWIEIIEVIIHCNAAFDVQLFEDSLNGSKRIAVFTNTSSGDLSPLSYQWTFGDDSTFFGTAPVHYYPQDGTYKVCLTVNSGGMLCQDSTCKWVTISSSTGLRTTQTDPLGIECYPVPVVDVLNWRVGKSTSGILSINLYSSEGRLLRHIEPGLLSSGSIDMHELNQGFYWLEFATQDSREMISIIK